ncbi:kelch repeat-containing protein [Myxococcota bacterium]
MNVCRLSQYSRWQHRGPFAWIPLLVVVSCADPFLHQLPEIPPLGLQVNAELITHIKTPVGELDRVRGEPGAVPSGVTEVRFWSEERGGELLGFANEWEEDGAFSESVLAGSDAIAYDRLWISAVDAKGIDGKRVYGKHMEQTLNLAGRVPYSSCPTPVALYPFAADRDPREIHPATGALHGEAWIQESVAGATMDDTPASFFVGPETRDVPGDWTLQQPMEFPRNKDQRMVYDTRRRRVVLVRGPNIYGVLETWEWDGSNWTEINTAITPPGRDLFEIAYDARRGVIVLFGGQVRRGVWCDDTWELDNGEWKKVTLAGSPPPRWGHAMAYDAGREVVVLFGGGANRSSPSRRYVGARQGRVEEGQSS